MKVFGVGANKTGTTTLGVCLQRLGYDHAPWDRDLAERVAGGDVVAAFDVADRFDSFEDWPWPVVFREMDERYPDARFILTTRRSSKAWINSLVAHAGRTGPTEIRRLVYGSEMPAGREAEHVARYETHNAAVRDHFAGRPNKLLEVCWETGSGWAQVCEFLGHPVVDEPFPHARARPRRKSLSRRLRSLLARAVSGG